MLRLGILGPPEVARDGVPAAFDTRKSIALLALLAQSPRPWTRDSIATMLWPEAEDARARASLRRTLSVTAAVAGTAMLVSRATVSLERSEVSCDLWDFERLAASDDRRSLSEAAALYRDDFLAGFRARAGAEYDLWQERVAEEQRQRLGDVLARLVTASVLAGTLEAALGQARRWLAIDVLHEPAHQALMRVLTWSGQRSAALAQYRSCVRILEEELGVEPLADTSALYEVIRTNRLAPPHIADTSGAHRDAGSARHGQRTATRIDAREQDAGVARLPALGQDHIVESIVTERDLCSEGGRVAVVAGAGGSGKTRILEAVYERLAGRGPWIRARCHPGEQILELGCVAELLQSAFDARPELSSLLAPDDLAEISRLVPRARIRHHAETSRVDTPGAQVRFFRAVTAAIAVAAAGTPEEETGETGVIVVEDVQHLDDASARILAYLLRRLDQVHALFVFTWRPELGAPPMLRGVLDELAATGRSNLYEPRPLGQSDVARVLEAAGLEASGAGELLARTGGLPLLVVAYAEAARADRTSFASTTPSDCGSQLIGAMPSAVRSLLAQRFSTVSQAAGQVLAAAAVLGNDFDAELLRATSGRSALEVADALDEALARGILAERQPSAEGSPEYEYPYDALRQVAYESCGRARRRLLHGRAADALGRRAEESGEDSRSSAISTHLELAGRPAEAASWSWRAAQRSLSLFAREEALDHLHRALDLGHPPSEAHLAIADVLVGLGRYREALAQLEQAASDVDTSGVHLSAIEHRLAAVQDRLGNWDVAATHLDAAYELASGDDVIRSRILADRTFVAYRSRDPEASSLVQRALEEARGSADAYALAQAHNVAGVLASLSGDAESAESFLRASLDASRPLHDPGAAVAALNNLARLLADLGRHDEAVATAKEALRRGEEHGDLHRLAALHSNLADLLHATGHNEESIAHLKEAATAFAGVDAGGAAVPRIWTLTEW